MAPPRGHRAPCRMMASPERDRPGAPADAPGAAPAIVLRVVRASDPLRWLACGWRDFARAPGIGLFYGGCFASMGWLLMILFEHAAVYTLALSAGFLLVSPFLCLGLYDVSRRMELGLVVAWPATLNAWRPRAATMAIFGAVLLVLEMLWARASLIVFALSFDGMPDFKGSVLALLDPDNAAFITAYAGVGGVFAAFIFAISVVAMPLMLDRPVDAITACLTSLRLCLTQPVPMLCWAALLSVLVALAMAPWFVGLWVVAPVLGHASWHAYRATVAA
jgi:uncharacterized membrane protein